MPTILNAIPLGIPSGVSYLKVVPILGTTDWLRGGSSRGQKGPFLPSSLPLRNQSNGKGACSYYCNAPSDFCSRDQNKVSYRLVQGHLFFLHHLADVDQRVAHTAQGGVDADAGQLGYFFEAHIGVMAQDDHLALLRRKHIHQVADAFVGLAAYNMLLGIEISGLQHIEDVEGVRGGNLGAALGAAEIIHAHVVGDAHGPL